MTQEEKELLRRDLCARLPYNVICQVEFKEYGKYKSEIMLLSGIFTDEAYFTTKDGSIYSNEYKPYLFPLSSMTEEEKEELKQEHIKDEKLYIECLTMAAKGDSSMRGKVIIHYAMDWCNKNHFDYRGLIEKGLAIDATGLNIY